MIKIVIFILLFQSISFSEDLEFYEFRFHGNFCGANLPKIDTKSKDEELKILKKIVPIDLIDEACKQHDICYLTTKKSVCDQKLVFDLKQFYNRLTDRSCRRLNQSIRYFFTIKTDNPLTLIKSDDSFEKKLFLMPAVTFSNMMDSASMSSVLGMNYGYRKPVGYVFDSDNNSERRKEILQVFPKRFKVCEVK